MKARSEALEKGTDDPVIDRRAIAKSCDVVEVGKNSYRVNRPEALQASEPSLRTGPGNVSWWHWDLYVELPNGEIAIFCKVIRPLLPPGSPHLNLYPKTSTVRGRPGLVALTKPRGSFRWTEKALELVIESHRRKFGEAPENLGGILAKSNFRNFQREFARIREASPDLSIQQIAQEAIELISFGKERIELGYEHLEVSLLRFGDVEVDGVVLKNMPTKVRVEASKAP